MNAKESLLKRITYKQFYDPFSSFVSIIFSNFQMLRQHLRVQEKQPVRKQPRKRRFLQVK